jgi:hypothetical protein
MLGTEVLNFIIIIIFGGTGYRASRLTRQVHYYLSNTPVLVVYFNVYTCFKHDFYKCDIFCNKQMEKS